MLVPIPATLTELFAPLTQDGRVGSRHISTYLALLQCQERYQRTYTSSTSQTQHSTPAHPTHPTNHHSNPAAYAAQTSFQAVVPAQSSAADHIRATVLPTVPSQSNQLPQTNLPAPSGRPFYIHRDEIMRLAKIQGRNTYYRIMSELDAWGYIEYWPSRRSTGASKVFLPLS